ncbi:MAG: shufflon system plasmid conjugative transfer pilus tip adhesin PilV [Alcaligenaceae bacterium]
MSTVKGEGGFALLELIIAMALASLLALWGGSFWMQQAEDAAAQSSGVWLLTLKKAVDQMLVRQADVLVGIVQPEPNGSGYNDIWRPTIAELIAAGHLSKGFPSKPALGYEAQVRVFTPEGACLTRGCKIEALVWAQPVAGQLRQANDTNRLGKLLTALEGHGASVHPFLPHRIKGASVDRPNPPSAELVALPVGTIAALSFYDSTQYAHFVRRFDLRDTVLKGQLEVAQSISTPANIVAGAAMRAQTRISAGEYLQVGALAVEGGVCDAQGLIGRGVDGNLLSCHQGRWQLSGASFGGVFLTHSWRSCHGNRHFAEFLPWDLYGVKMVNPKTGQCNCPVGFAPVLLAAWRFQEASSGEYRTFMCLR